MCNLKIEAMDRAGELPLETKMNEEKFSKPLDNLSSAAVRGEAVANGGWNVIYDKDTESDHYAKHSDALAAARRLAQGGRFDVRIVEAATPVSAHAADAPSEPSESKTEDVRIANLVVGDFIMENGKFRKISNLSQTFSTLEFDIDGVSNRQSRRLMHAVTRMIPVESRAADALDSQPTEIDDLEDLIVQHRIAIMPENEGGFHAHVYGDDEVPAARGYGATPREAINAAFAATQPTVAAQQGSIGDDARYLGLLQNARYSMDEDAARTLLSGYIDSLLNSRAPAAPVAPLAPDAGPFTLEQRMPPKDVEVLIYVKYQDGTGAWRTDEWSELHEDPIGMGGPTICVGEGWLSYGDDDVTHWAPLLPAPQQEGSEAGNG